MGWEVVVIEVVIIEVGVVRIIPRIITGTFVTRRTTCRGDRFTTHEGVFVVAGGGDWPTLRLAGLRDEQGSRTEQNCDER